MAGLLIRGGRILAPGDGLDTVGDLVIEDGRITQIGPKAGEGLEAAGYQLIEATGCVVAPGFVDLHCHLREPGEEDKETIATGSLAAVAGGFTTICCMPNTIPPIDNRGTLEFVLEQGRAADLVRVLPVAAISKGRQGKELTEMAELAEAGAVAFSDDGSPVSSSRLMRHALHYSTMLNRPIIDHPQDMDLTEGAPVNEGSVAHRLGLRGMPAAAEEIIVARDILLAELTGGRLHLAHISTAGSVELVRRAKERGLPVTAEVTPHHLVMTEELVAGKWPTFPGSRAAHLPYDTNTKMNPPLRTVRDVQALVRGLREGVIDAIATDHAPHTLVDKQCEYDSAAFGISGLETALAALLLLVEAGALDLPTVVERLTAGPARALGLDAGHLKVGGPADIVVFDPKLEWVVTPEALHTKGKNTPFLGETLRGRVVATIREGRVVWHSQAGLTERSELNVV